MKPKDEKGESTDSPLPHVTRIQSPTQKEVEAPMKERKLLLYFFSFLTVSLSSGLIYGYPHFRTNLLLNNSTLTESQLGIIFTVGGWTVQGGWFFSGLSRDTFGTRNVAFTCLLFSTLGCTGLAFSSENDLIWLSASFFFVGLGSGGMLCFQPVASLFSDKWQGTVLASLSGAFQISGLVFLVLRKLTLDRSKSFAFFSLILLLLALISLCILPKGEFVTAKDDSENVNADGNDNGNFTTDDINVDVNQQNHSDKEHLHGADMRKNREKTMSSITDTHILTSDCAEALQLSV